MLDCPFCTTTIEEKYRFCPSCDRRIKCAECDELLLEGKNKCYVCGEPLDSAQDERQALNTFQVEEEQDEDSFRRSISIEVSDEGIHEAARIASHFFGYDRLRVDKTLESNLEAGESPQSLLPSTPSETTNKVSSDSASGTSPEQPQENGPMEIETEDGDTGINDFNTSDIDIRRLSYNYERVILALYDLTERNKGMDSARPIDVYEHLESNYGRNTLSKQDVRSNMSSYKNEYFEKTDEGKYYLTVDACDKVESWIDNGYGGDEE